MHSHNFLLFVRGLAALAVGLTGIVTAAAAPWINAGTLIFGRDSHTATLLPNGKVLVAAGFGRSGETNSAELYDPSSDSWTATDPLPVAVYGHSATLLPNGKVLVAGGQGASGVTAAAEVFDPASGPNGKWTAVNPMNSVGRFHTAMLLPNGNVLVAGGQDTNFTVIGTSELYDVGLGFAGSSRPQSAGLNSPLNLVNSLTLTGSKFRGLSEGAGGNSSQDSPGDGPVVQLRNIESGRVRFLTATSWQTNSYVSLPVTNFPAGQALATVFVNGIPGNSAVLRIAPAPVAIVLTQAAQLGDGSFQFSFTNTPGAVFTTLASTNLSLSLSNWTALGSPTEFASGQFQFTDSQSTNISQRFYRVSSL